VTAPAGHDLDLREIEQFGVPRGAVRRRARLHAWEALWTDDAVYWVPAGGDLTEPGGQMSVIHDNRNRVTTRLNQLRTGRRHAQSPPSSLRRVRFLDALELETIIWLPDGHLTQLLDPSADRWRDA
jgi:benzoate/toluate 1,2-dioxygenase subunit beta